MGGLDAQEIIGVWERGRRASSHERALLLAELAGLDRSESNALAIGTRDAALAAERIARFGVRARAAISCPSCREGLEFNVNFQAARELGFTQPGEGPWLLEHESFSLRFRLPSTTDLMAVAEHEKRGESGRAALLERIVLDAARNGDPVSPKVLPEAVIAAVEAEIERLDPISDIRFAQACPTCQYRFEAPFDIARFCWHELDVDARRLLQEVDLLARSYGWSESEILGMSRVRRLTYLEMCGLT